MEAGLIAFVEGRLTRDFWSPRKDLDVRKLAALEALSRYGKASGAMLGSITIAPNQWPTSAVIDWLNILKRVQDVPQRQQRMDEANNVLKARLSYQGTKLIFSTERDDYWWWLMTNGDVNTARLLLTVMDDPSWKDDIGKLANGFIGRQQNGAWHTTTANLWGGLALEVQQAVREHAGGRHHRRHPGRGQGAGRLEQGRAREGQRSGRRAEPDHLLRRPGLAG